jgi:hypothetical protein
VKREATIAGLASEGLAMISGSAGAGSSAVVGPTPTDPVEFRKCGQDLKTLSAAQKHTNEERGGSRDPGVRRPGAGRGQLPARSKIFDNPLFVCLRVEFLLKTDSGYPKDTGVNKPWQPLRIPFAITPIGQLHQSPPSPIPGDLGRGPSHQSTCSNIETRMDRPKSVVRVIRGVA